MARPAEVFVRPLRNKERVWLRSLRRRTARLRLPRPRRDPDGDLGLAAPAQRRGAPRPRRPAGRQGPPAGPSSSGSAPGRLTPRHSISGCRSPSGPVPISPPASRPTGARWAQSRDARVRLGAPCAYIEATMPDGYDQPLFRLRWTTTVTAGPSPPGSPTRKATEVSVLPSGALVGPVEEAMARRFCEGRGDVVEQEVCRALMLRRT